MTTQVQIKFDRSTGTEANRHSGRGFVHDTRKKYKDTLAKESSSSLPWGREIEKFIYEIYTQNKDKFDVDKISFKNDTTCINYTLSYAH